MDHCNRFMSCRFMSPGDAVGHDRIPAHREANMTMAVWKPSHTPRELFSILAIVAVLICGTNQLLAQVDAGAILGTVKDSTGRIIPGAKVTVTNDETGVVVNGTTNSTGEYTFSPIKIGI